MSQLHEECPACRRAYLQCPACGGKGYVATGLDSGQVERAIAERDAMQELSEFIGAGEWEAAVETLFARHVAKAARLSRPEDRAGDRARAEQARRLLMKLRETAWQPRARRGDITRGEITGA